MKQHPTPTEPLCDQPPPRARYLDRRYASSQKGGTTIREDVQDWAEHQRRLCSPDGYRPASCEHCGCTKLHGDGFRDRVLRGDLRRRVQVRRYRCVGCRARWLVLPGFVARHLWRTWQAVEAELTDGAGSVPEATGRRWRMAQASDGRVVRHLLATAPRPTWSAVVRAVGVSVTRGQVIAEYREQDGGEGCYARLAGALHRLAPGVRMM